CFPSPAQIRNRNHLYTRSTSKIQRHPPATMGVAEPTKMRNLRYPVRLREKRMARIPKLKSKFLFVIGMVGLSAFWLMPGLAHSQSNASNEPQNIIAFLNQTLAWYRQVNAQ